MPRTIEFVRQLDSSWTLTATCNTTRIQRNATNLCTLLFDSSTCLSCIFNVYFSIEISIAKFTVLHGDGIVLEVVLVENISCSWCSNRLREFIWAEKYSQVRYLSQCYFNKAIFKIDSWGHWFWHCYYGYYTCSLCNFFLGNDTHEYCCNFQNESMICQTTSFNYLKRHMEVVLWWTVVNYSFLSK